MKDEICAAVAFLSRLIKNHDNIKELKLVEFKKRLEELLIEQFQDHWFPDNPFKGQGYRCIRVNETERMDPILKRAADDCKLNYNDLNLPNEFTIWVDPNEVCCRLGEIKGPYCTVAKFNNGNKENYADQINIEHLEKKSAELAKQASAEIMSGFKRNRRHRNSDHSTPPHHHLYSPNMRNGSPILYSNSSPNTYIVNSPSSPYHPDKSISSNIRRSLYGNINKISNHDDINGSPCRYWNSNSNWQ